MIQHRFGFFIKSSDAETARCPAKENLFLTLSERELNQLCSFNNDDKGYE